MKRIGFFALVAVLVLGGWLYFGRGAEGELLNPLARIESPREKPYDQYSFARLAERPGQPGQIEVAGEKFYYRSGGRRISGQIKTPAGEGKFPVILMARGYVEKEEYVTGIGTKNAAAVYAENGYLTLAPDFSGYGESDPEDENALGARLTKPVEILDLLASLPSLPAADTQRVFLWGHSNGGQIMLSVAEILSKQGNESVKGITLWAPVSKPFPYNILYYTDEAEDRGKWLRAEIAKFEAEYDVYNYSLDRYMDWIKLPILIHQGSADPSVPQKWSDELTESLTKLEKEVTYYVYPGADHNMKPAWNTVVSRDLKFFDLFTSIPQ